LRSAIYAKKQTAASFADALCNLFFPNTIRLKERSPEQYEIIKDVNMRNEMEKLENLLHVDS